MNPTYSQGDSTDGGPVTEPGDMQVDDEVEAPCGQGDAVALKSDAEIMQEKEQRKVRRKLLKKADKERQRVINEEKFRSLYRDSTVMKLRLDCKTIRDDRRRVGKSIDGINNGLVAQEKEADFQAWNARAILWFTTMYPTLELPVVDDRIFWDWHGRVLSKGDRFLSLLSGYMMKVDSPTPIGNMEFINTSQTGGYRFCQSCGGPSVKNYKCVRKAGFEHPVMRLYVKLIGSRKAITKYESRTARDTVETVRRPNATTGELELVTGYARQDRGLFTSGLPMVDVDKAWFEKVYPGAYVPVKNEDVKVKIGGLNGL